MSLTDSSPLLLHNPRCSKSRAAKAWLEEQGLDYTERLYLEDPLTHAELVELGELLQLPVRDWIRTGESVHGECQLSDASTEEQLSSAICEHPVLLERPIVVHGQRAAIGRPLERVIQLFQQ